MGAVPWRMLSTVGVFSTVRVHECRGGYLEYRGDIMINVEDILSTVGGVQHRGGYHEYRWGLF